MTTWQWLFPLMLFALASLWAGKLKYLMAQKVLVLFVWVCLLGLLVTFFTK